MTEKARFIMLLALLAASLVLLWLANAAAGNVLIH
jgi:hypothetical protein